MSAGNGGAHDFKLYSSRIFSVLLYAVYTISILIVFILPAGLLAKAALTAALIFSLRYALRRDVWLLLPSSYVAIRLDGDRIFVRRRMGSDISGQVLRDSVVTPLLTVLNVVPQGKRRMRSIIIFPDSMDKERFRELRVLLKWNGNAVSRIRGSNSFHFHLKA